MTEHEHITLKDISLSDLQDLINPDIDGMTRDDLVRLSGDVATIRMVAGEMICWISGSKNNWRSGPELRTETLLLFRKLEYVMWLLSWKLDRDIDDMAKSASADLTCGNEEGEIEK